jgi:predicted aconitase with swiveling domain
MRKRVHRRRGAIIAGIPMVDHVDITQIKTGDWVAINGASVTWQGVVKT